MGSCRPLGPDKLPSPLQAARPVYWASDMTNYCKLEQIRMSIRNTESELMRVTDDTYTIRCSRILCPKTETENERLWEGRGFKEGEVGNAGSTKF